MFPEMALLQAVGPPCWDSGLPLPTLPDETNPVQEAHTAVVKVTEAMCGRRGGLPRDGGAAVAVVDEVFTLVQLALDSRRVFAGATEEREAGVSPRESAFRAALLPGALGLVTRLATALQPSARAAGDGKSNDGATSEEEEESEAGGNRGMRDAVLAAARHVSAMEELVANQNNTNTSALLVAHNALAKLLKSRWQWLIGGVLDAPRLLAQLSAIYRDGLSQLKVELAEGATRRAGGSLPHGAEDRSAAAAAAATAETARLKKYGKLLATFGARMSCLLRHLGPECAPGDRRQAFRLFAQAVAGVYPGLVEAKTAGRGGEASPSSLAGIVADVVYPRAVEAFLSAAGPSPCWPNEHDCDDDTKTAGFVDNAGSSASSTTGVKSVNDISQTAAVARNKIGEDGMGGGDGGCGVDSSRCRCYHSSAGVAAMLEPARRGVSCKRQRTKQHDPWDAFEALRPEQQPPQPPLSKNPGGNGGSRSAFAAAVVAEDSEASGIGAVLLLCEALSCEETRLSKTVRARLGECCSWILDHLSYLFPSWVEAAAAPEGVGTDKKEARSWYERARLVSPLCQKAAAALGCYVSRRAVAGEFEDVQIQILEGCACHPHPLCREIWCGALRVFVQRCDTVAQESIVQTFAEATLNPQVSSRCRRRLAYALHTLTRTRAGSIGGPPATSFDAVDVTTDSSSGSAGIAASATDDLRPAVTTAQLRRLCLAQLLPSSAPLQSCSLQATAAAMGGNDDGPHPGLEPTTEKEGGGGTGGTCALDLLRDVRCLLQAGEAAAGAVDSPAAGVITSTDGRGEDGRRAADTALADASIAFAQSALTSCLRGGNEMGHCRNGNKSTTMNARNSERCSGDTKRESRADGDPQVTMIAATRFFQAAAVTSSVPNRPDRRKEADAAKEAGWSLGEAVRAGWVVQGSAMLFERALAAHVGLLMKTDVASMPKLCASIVTRAGDGQVSGVGLLALAEALSCLSRHPVAAKEAAGGAWETVLADGFATLFASGLWPVTTSAMQALEAMARHADPRTARLLPKLVPESLLAAFKARLARRIVTLKGTRPVELATVRERGAVEQCILHEAAARVMAREKNGSSRLENEKQNVPGGKGQRQLQVTLRERGDLRALAGLLSSKIVRIQPLSGADGGGVCITLDACS